MSALVIRVLASSSEDTQWADLLWESGCCVTIQVRLCEDGKKKALCRHMASEKVKVMGSPANSDTFLSFAKLVRTMGITKQKEGEDLHLRYNNAPYNAAIHKAAAVLLPVLQPSGPCPVQAAFRRIDLAFGRELLSNQYSKISKLVSLGKSGASASRPAATVTAWLVDQLLLALRGKQVLPSKATEQWLDRDRKSGSPGFWPCCLVILQAQVANKCSCQR